MNIAELKDKCVSAIVEVKANLLHSREDHEAAMKGYEVLANLGEVEHLTLQEPLVITPRGLIGVKIGNIYLSVKRMDRRCIYYVDLPQSYTSDFYTLGTTPKGAVAGALLFLLEYQSPRHVMKWVEKNEKLLEETMAKLNRAAP